MFCTATDWIDKCVILEAAGERRVAKRIQGEELVREIRRVQGQYRKWEAPELFPFQVPFFPFHQLTSFMRAGKAIALPPLYAERV